MYDKLPQKEKDLIDKSWVTFRKNREQEQFLKRAKYITDLAPRLRSLKEKLAGLKKKLGMG